MFDLFVNTSRDVHFARLGDSLKPCRDVDPITINVISLDNYISMVSGQPPNPQTQADCQRYNDWVGSNDPMPTGTGC